MTTSDVGTVGTSERSKSQQIVQNQVYILTWASYDDAGIKGVFAGENATEAAKQKTADDAGFGTRFDPRAWEEDQDGNLINESDGHILYTISAHNVVS